MGLRGNEENTQVAGTSVRGIGVRKVPIGRQGTAFHLQFPGYYFIPVGTFFLLAPLIYEPAWTDGRCNMRMTLDFGRIALGLAIASLPFQWNKVLAQNSYFQRNLVSDIAGMAEKTDTNLVSRCEIRGQVVPHNQRDKNFLP